MLSLLMGLLSEVTGGVIVLRALFSGLFFAVLISAARFALIRFLPGFGDDTIQEETDEDGVASGEEGENGFQARQVDIVLGQEDEETGSDSEEEEDVEDFDSGDDFVPQKLGAASSAGSSEPEDEAVEEVEEVEYSASEKTTPPGGNSSSSRGGIPDIGQFEATFTGGEEDSLGPKKSNPVSAEILGGVHDTEEMAKAVHTILQKDQEG